MDKSFDTDIQILQNILLLQYKMDHIVESYEDTDLLLDNQKDLDLLEFYTLKAVNLTKGLTTKTKKIAPSFIDKELTELLNKELNSCYPTLSKEEKLKIASRLCSDPHMTELKFVLREFTDKASN